MQMGSSLKKFVWSGRGRPQSSKLNVGMSRLDISSPHRASPHTPSGTIRSTMCIQSEKQKNTIKKKYQKNAPSMKAY